MFDLKEILKTHGSVINEIKDSDGNVIPFMIGFEKDKVWWGQPSGSLRAELGFSSDKRTIYLLEGDSKYFGRKSLLDIDSREIKYTTVQQASEELMKIIRGKLADWILNEFKNLNLKESIIKLKREKELQKWRQEE